MAERPSAAAGPHRFTRRQLARGAGALAAACALPACGCGKRVEARPLRTPSPKRAAVLWYSQTGHTELYGRLLAKRWERAGLSVLAGDYRRVGAPDWSALDLVVVGTPVHYMDVPRNVTAWLSSLRGLAGAGVAAYATFGGPGDGQHNTACSVLELLQAAGGVPLGLATFGNMSTFAPTWSLGNEKRTLAYRHLPDEGTFGRVRDFAAQVLAAATGPAYIIDREYSFVGMFGGLSRWGTKVAMGDHGIDAALCAECGRCEETCPAGAISVKARTVDEDRCLACFGCVNNCPTGAMKLSFTGKPVVGWQRFLESRKIAIAVPEELRT